jgi:hypothetical protein
MLTKIKLGLGAISLLLSVGGCGAAPRSNASAKTQAETATSAGTVSPVFSCKVDSDCVVIEDDSSCIDGVLVAVNQDHADDYCGDDDAAVDCSIPALFDTRVAQCDFTAHACRMIEPTEIHCGGFITPNHGCPDGFRCDFHGHVPDVGGTCVAVAN